MNAEQAQHEWSQLDSLIDDEVRIKFETIIEYIEDYKNALDGDDRLTAIMGVIEESQRINIDAISDWCEQMDNLKGYE